MFSPLTIFVLLTCALIAITADIVDPFSNLVGQMKGKSAKQIKDEVTKTVYVVDQDGKEVLDEDGDPKINWRGLSNKAGGWCCSACLFMAVLLPLSWLVGFVVEPIFAITAITKGIGNIYVAYGALVIILIAAFRFVYSIGKVVGNSFKKVKPEEKPGPNATPEELVAYEVRKQVEEQKVSVTNASLFWLTMRRIFFALPDLYLVYLLVLALLPK